MYLSHNAWKKMYPGLPCSKQKYYNYLQNIREEAKMNYAILSPQQAADIALAAAKDFFAPTPTCTNNLVPCPEQKGNNPMFEVREESYYGVTAKKQNATPEMAVQVVAETKTDTAQDQRKYLERRVNDIKGSKYNEIAQQFFWDEPAAPKSVAELKERLKKGLYTIEDREDDYAEDDFYWRNQFSWRTPETQFDKVGYKAANNELELFLADIIDQIKILDPKEGLALLDDLKKWKPSKAKK